LLALQNCSNLDVVGFLKNISSVSKGKDRNEPSLLNQIATESKYFRVKKVIDENEPSLLEKI